MKSFQWRLVCNPFLISFILPLTDTINQRGSFQIAAVFLIALIAEVFMVYFTIQSFTLHLEIDWLIMFSLFSTIIWSLYLVLPTFGVIYAAAITSEEVWQIYHHILCLRNFFIRQLLMDLVMKKICSQVGKKGEMPGQIFRTKSLDWGVPKSLSSCS
jgi:hypothetical protein